MDPNEPVKHVAIRRWADACFHRVDEVVEEGYIIGSVLIPKEDVLEVRDMEEGETCRRRQGVEIKLPGTNGLK